MKTTSLQDKVCIVTGAASGIGHAVVMAFLEAGAAGVTLVDLHSDSLSNALGSIPLDLQQRTLCIAGDVGAEVTAQTYVKATIERWGKLDISVQCAGVSMRRTSLLDSDVSILDRLWRTNVRGSYLGLQESAKAMLASPSQGKGCSIILFGSQIGLEGGTQHPSRLVFTDRP
ncbi:hypothetical protein P7C73_g801, partial [Tremellales sp. Uapishka_1]